MIFFRISAGQTPRDECFVNSIRAKINDNKNQKASVTESLLSAIVHIFVGLSQQNFDYLNSYFFAQVFILQVNIAKLSQIFLNARM